MISKEEIEKARSNLLRGNDIESACLIMEEIIWNGLVITGGRVNIEKIAMRQILNFVQEYKDKGYIDIIREKVQTKEKNKELEQKNNKQNKIIDEMAKEINAKVLTKEQWCPLLSKEGGCHANDTCLQCLKQYFEKKVEKKEV